MEQASRDGAAMVPAALSLKEVLEGINARTICLEIIEAPTWNGFPKYRSAGWTLCVFDDCGDWDYLEWVESPDGRRIEFRTDDPSEKTYTEEERLLQDFSAEHDEDWGYE